MNDDELNKLLNKYYFEDWEKFFKVIKDNNLLFDDYLIINKENYEVYCLGSNCAPIIRDFYNYWLKHNSSNTSSFNNGFINLRC